MQRLVQSTRPRPLRVSALSWGCVAALVVACSPGSAVDGEVTVERDPVLGAGGAGGNTGVLPTPEQILEELYERPPPPDCADFEKGDDEACDDGNRDSGDGCSSNCLVVESGYVCDEAGRPCVLVELCGDGRRVLTEGCDDGNAVALDGCASNCQPEAGFSCPVPGEACVSTLVCGDGFIALGEGCDDGNQVAADGCSEVCALETGWQCLIPGGKCTPICGDGLLTGNERCDDANAATPGCDANCRLEPLFVCPVPGQACVATDCLDGTREGSEQCDDGNLAPYDGCSTTCTNEPECGFVNGVYACGAVCGDGMKFPEEACDDGNTQPDDGCSPVCQLEPGYRCTDQAAALGTILPLPIIYRDFSNGHPQFEIDPLNSPRLPNIVLPQLGANGKPVYNEGFTFLAAGQAQPRAWTMDGPAAAAGVAKAASGAPTLNAAAAALRFAEWYTDVPGQNQTFFATLDLGLLADEQSFQFSATGVDNQFFPIDGLGFGNQGSPNNFHFTSEVRQWFQAQGDELLSFSGDDDVWVFVNGQLTVDLGGIHGEIRGSILLSADGTDSTLCLEDNVGTGLVCDLIDVPVSPNVNEIVVFQAERHVTASNYTLTLRGFNAPVTTCESVCNDGVVTPDETCDDGELNGTGYNQCVRDACVPGPRCGDGVVEAGVEQCDNGANQDGYVVSESSCAPGCLTPSRCGDNVIDAAFGEQCDDGVNDNSYGGCSPACLLGPRCGDGVPDETEECDDGNRRNTDGCNVNCDLERLPA